ncbi:hypothetical protein J7E99_32200 [Streptomyces sp. ISL-44]|uniref:DUF6801 domain-containing protein n=1 Tax=Streptomyces sp. ISL-44 TaxID=2819184 RepID=UPI001BE5B4C5|nr:DUF6801 domain-containing protein [Streptomyces sp. ISL-44]MBT2545241.1 hypothetical protein [Streptomyces sp. ISL-44]
MRAGKHPEPARTAPDGPCGEPPDPVSLTLRYTCSTGLVGNLPLTVRIRSDVPWSAAAGKPSPAFPFHAAVPVPAEAARTLAGMAVRAVEGRMEAQVRVAAPEGDRRVKVPVGVKAGIPAAGSLHIEASGTAPALTFAQAGSARITVGDLVAHLTLKDARDEIVYPGAIDARCTPDTGQSNLLASFRITRAGTEAGTVTGTEAGIERGTTTEADTEVEAGTGTETDAGRGASGATGAAGEAATPAAPVPPAADRTASGGTGSTPPAALPGTGDDLGLWLLGGVGVLLATGVGTLFAARRTRTPNRRG